VFLLNNQPENLSKETHWEKAAKTRMGKYLTQIEANFILNSIDISKVNLIVDVGAEAGRFSEMAANDKVAVVGIDIDAYSLRRLKLRNKDISVIQADARKMPFRSDLFDAVFMIEVLDYIPELNETLGECNRILKPESAFILSFGNSSSIKAKLRELKGKTYTHSFKKVMNSLADVGFKVESKKGYSWLPFGRMSQSKLLPLIASLERIIGLRRIPSLSPWVILHARKSP
jgi:ubiquinone/menaquinone biosynthesis C-methylase UbiE